MAVIASFWQRTRTTAENAARFVQRGWYAFQVSARSVSPSAKTRRAGATGVEVLAEVVMEGPASCVPMGYV